MFPSSLCLVLQILFYPEGEGSRFIQNVEISLPYFTLSRPRTPSPSAWAYCMPQEIYLYFRRISSVQNLPNHFPPKKFRKVLVNKFFRLFFISSKSFFLPKLRKLALMYFLRLNLKVNFRRDLLLNSWPEQSALTFP
jgi:hypothetical protein